MKKKKVTVLSLILIANLTNAFSQESFGASGSTNSSSSGSVSYTVGQVFYEEQLGSNGKVEQGVQHAYEIYALGITENTNIAFSLGVFPNPTVDNLQLTMDQTKKGMSYQLFDSQGKMLSKQEIVSNTTVIEMSNLVPESYLLKVLEGAEEVQVFKIIKN